MANMSYCRMHNTSRDLRDVIENWDSANSKDEQEARLRIWEMACEIAEWDKPEIDGVGDDEDEDDEETE